MGVDLDVMKERQAGEIAALEGKYEEEIWLLVEWLRRTHEGDAILAECDSLERRKILFKTLRRRLEDEGVYLQEVLVTRQELAVVRTLQHLVQRSGFKDIESIERYHNIAFFVYGMEDLDPADQDRLLVSLNFSRDALQRVHYPVVFWANRDFLVRLAWQASDFWAKTGRIFTFQDLQAPAPTTRPPAEAEPVLRYLRAIKHDPDFRPWTELYVPLHLSDPSPEEFRRRWGLGIEAGSGGWEPAALEMEADESRRTGTRREPRIYDLEEAVERFRRMLIVGEPGAGKTTALRYLMARQAREAELDLEQDRDTHSPIPLFLRLGSWKGESLESQLEETLTRYDLPNPFELVQQFLHNRETILLLDGLNEVPLDQQEGLGWVLRDLLSHLSDRQHVLLTCRIQDYPRFRRWLEAFEVKVLQPLTESEEKTFLIRYLGEERGREVFAQMDERLRDLGSNPLALRMLAALAKRSPEKRLPTNRGQLLYDFTHELLTETDVRWREQLAQGRGHVQVAFMESVLAELGFRMLDTGRTSLEREICLTVIREMGRDRAEAVRAEDVLDELLASGLVRLSHNRADVEFMHQEVQEFYAALALRDSGRGLASYIEHCVAGMREDRPSRWLPVLARLYGITLDRPTLYRHIVRQGNNADRIFVFAECLQYTGLEGEPIIELESWSKSDEDRAILNCCLGAAYRDLLEKEIERYGVEGHEVAQLHEEATTRFQQAIKLKPDYALVYNQIGILYAWQEEYEAAIEFYRRATELMPSRSLYWTNFGRNSREVDQLEEAISAFQEAIVQAKAAAPIPTDELYEALKEMGITMRQMDRMEEAIPYFQGALKLDVSTKDSAAIYNQLGLTRFARGEYAQALKAVQKGVELDAENAIYHYNVGRCCLEVGERGEAIVAFQKAIRLRPDYTDAYNWLGVTHFRESEHAQALEAQQKAVELDAENAVYHRNVGMCHLKLDQPDEAIAAFQEAIRLRPDDADTHNQLGRAYFAEGEYAQALAAFRKAVELDPEDAVYHHNVGMCHLELDQPGEAISAFQEAIRLRPDDADAHNQLGRAYFAEGEHARALEEYQKAAELDPENAVYWHNMGRRYLSLEQPDEAIAAFQKAIRLRSDYAAAYNQLGRAYFAEGEHAQALEAFQKAVDLAPENAVYHRNVGMCHLELDQSGEAIAAFQEVVRLRPNDADAHNQLGGVYFAEGEYAQALEATQKAVELEPENAVFHRNVGMCHLELDRPDEAIAAFQEAIRLRPDDVPLYSRLDHVYHRHDMYVEALEMAQKAVKLAPDDSDLHCDLAHDLRKLKCYDEALEAAHQAIELAPDSAYAYRTLADIHRDMEQYATAITEYQRAVGLDVDDVPAHVGLGDAYAALSRHAEAMKAYEAAARLEPEDEEIKTKLAQIRDKLEASPQSVVSFSE